MAINISDFRELTSDAYNLLRLFLKTVSLSADGIKDILWPAAALLAIGSLSSFYQLQWAAVFSFIRKRQLLIKRGDFDNEINMRVFMCR